MLSSADRWLATSPNFGSPADCLTVQDRRDRLSRNVRNCHSALRNIGEERRSRIQTCLFSPQCLPSCTRSVLQVFWLKFCEDIWFPLCVCHVTDMRTLDDLSTPVIFGERHTLWVLLLRNFLHLSLVLSLNTTCPPQHFVAKHTQFTLCRFVGFTGTFLLRYLTF